MMAYADYMSGKLQDYSYPAELVAAAMADLPNVPA